MVVRDKSIASFLFSLAAICLCGLSPSAWAGSYEVYDFSFTGSDYVAGNPSSGLSGSGILYTQELVPNSGIDTVVGGSINQLSWPHVSTYSTPPAFELVTNPNSNGSSVYSADGAFIYDDLLYPENMDTPSSSKVDYWGLLFQQAGTGAELNLYSQDLFGTPYIYYEKTGNNESLASFTLLNTGNTVNEIPSSAAVPLPASAGVGFSMLGGATVLASLRKRFGRRYMI